MNQLHPDLNIIINRLKEVGVTTKRFLPVNSEKQAYTNWTLNPLDVEDLHKEKSIGVAGREGLIIIDADKPEMKAFIDKYFPKTFTTTSPRRQLPHYWFKLNGTISILLKNATCYFNGVIESCGEIRSDNYYVVSPPTEITYKDLTNGETKTGKYTIQNNIPIAEITTEFLSEIFDKILDKNRVRPKIETIKKGVIKGERNPSGFRLALNLFREDKLDYNAVSTYMELWNQKNEEPLSPNELKTIIDHANKYAIQDPIITHKVSYPDLFIGEKPEIELPGLGKNISRFTGEIIKVLDSQSRIFLRTESREKVEVGKIKHKNDGREEFTGFINISPARLINILEDYMVIGKTVPLSLKEKNKKRKELEVKGTKLVEGKAVVPEISDDNIKQTKFMEKSLDMCNSNLVLNSPKFEESLDQISRILTVPTPIITKEGELIFPKQGFDQRFSSWLPYDAPTISHPNMSLEEAKKCLDTIFEEFCFKDKDKNQDKTNAIAALLTPLCKGLMPSFSTRNPLFAYIGNRERTGKDYLAGITGIIYEGASLEASPISTKDNSKSNKSEELRKLYGSALIQGRTRLHFSNNKGHIDNAVLEQVITNEFFEDRVLGSSKMLKYPNEIYLSISGNAGISYTPDLANRCIFINLFYGKEDANAREFKKPNLHQIVLENRSQILSALYALIKNWVNKGKPAGTVPFTSFYHWAKIVGGIMESAGYGSPCKPNDDNLDIGGDTSTKDMKTLYGLCYEKYESDKKPLTREDMRNLAIEAELFSYLQLIEVKGKISFGILLKKFKGREFSGINMKCVDIDKAPAKQQYTFELEPEENESDPLLCDICGKHTSVMYHPKNSDKIVCANCKGQVGD